ncbi:MAG: alpha/beta hydrolase [Aggregatilineales bacterium]
MQHVISKDGTRIAYDKTGSGQPVILVAGAFSYRKFPGSLELVDLLKDDFTVFNYDRRGRGDSGDTPLYAVEREIEDLEAVIAEAGGSAYVWGLSSGAALALKAAESGLNITKLVLYEPPFIVDANDPQPPPDFETHIKALIAADKRGEAVTYFMTKGMGAPVFVPWIMRVMPGVWKRLKAVAHTLPYDVAIVKDHASGKPFEIAQWKNVTMPTLVINGEKSGDLLRHTAKALSEVLPNAQHRTLEGQSHNVSMKVLAPILKEFYI